MIAVLGIAVALVVGGVVGLLRWWENEQRFRAAEHAAWPKSTPLTAFATTSPGGAFVTRAAMHGGDGLSSHPENHDCIYVAPVSCPDHGIEVGAQDRAACQDSWWACRASDGRLLHERFGVKLRWVEASHVELSWTELTGLDPAKHRVWGRNSETYRISTTRRASAEPDAAHCEALELRAEPRSPGR
jgi:hypothetical protein